MKAKLILSVALLLGVAVTSVQAQTGRDRDRNEHRRIEEGRRSGELTRGEARRLQKEQRSIAHDHYRFKHNDGYLSRRERRELKRRQCIASHHIYRYKHNRYDRK